MNASLYILLRAVDRFQATSGRLPWHPPRVCMVLCWSKCVRSLCHQ